MAGLEYRIGLSKNYRGINGTIGSISKREGVSAVWVDTLLTEAGDEIMTEAGDIIVHEDTE